MRFIFLLLLYFDAFVSDEIPVGPRRMPHLPRPSTPNLPNFGRRMRRGVQGAVEFIRHSRCERHRPRYEALITEALSSTVQNVNVQCECHSRHWMACSCATDNDADLQALNSRLDPDQPEASLRPFQVMDFSFFLAGLIPIRPMVIFTHGRCHVYADILVTRTSEQVTLAQRYLYGADAPAAEPIPLPGQPAQPSLFLQAPPELMYIITEAQELMDQMNLNPGSAISDDAHREARERSREQQNRIRRTHSAPARVAQAFHPENFMAIHLCQDAEGKATCPIMLTDFEPHDIVYILKTDVDKVREGKSVVCISSEGLMKLSRTPDSIRDYGFVDPLKRTGEQFLTVEHDFIAYILVGESEFCSDGEDSPMLGFTPGVSDPRLSPLPGGIPSSDSQGSDSDSPPPGSSQAGSSSAHSRMKMPPSEERVSISLIASRFKVFIFIFVAASLYFYILFTFKHQNDSDQYYLMVKDNI